MDAVVTGHSSGIGKEIYDNLIARRGPKQLVLGISRLRESRDTEASLDLTIPTHVTMALDFISHRMPTGIDVLINNAGALEIDEYERGRNWWTHLWNLHVVAPYELSIALRPLLAKRQGVIINVASVSGMMSCPDVPIYGATKAALISLTKSLAKSFAPTVRVNCISPGFVATNLVNNGEPPPKSLINKVPLKYEAQPTELLPAVEFLIQSRYTTGANVVVDGGYSL